MLNQSSIFYCLNRNHLLAELRSIPSATRRTNAISASVMMNTTAHSQDGQKQMATLLLEISPELEQQLRAEAARKGLEPGHYVLTLLQQQLQPAQEGENPSVNLPISSLPPTEADLLQQINFGLSAEEWELYYALIAKRQAETLTDEEHVRLIEISDQIEIANARRIAALIQLAALRSTSLETEMRNLGIEAPAHE